MYEEEYYVAILPLKDDVLIYKYFSELSSDQLELQGTRTSQKDVHLERGNILG
jgi:hypothetical protein